MSDDRISAKDFPAVQQAKKATKKALEYYRRMSYQITEPERTSADEIERLRAENERLAKEVNHWREARRTAIQAGDVLKAEHERLLSENLILQRGREEDERDHRGDMHALYAARSLVARQAEDEALWFAAITATEAYLQAALRELHAAVEGVRDE